MAYESDASMEKTSSFMIPAYDTHLEILALVYWKSDAFTDMDSLRSVTCLAVSGGKYPLDFPTQ